MSLSDQGVTRERYMLIPRMAVFLRRGEDDFSAARRELMDGTGRIWMGIYSPKTAG